MATFNGTLDGYDLMRTLQHWETSVEDLKTQLSDVQQRLEDAQRNVRACLEVIDLCKAFVEEPNIAYGRHSHIHPRELINCKTQMDAAAEIARQSDGFIKLADAAKLLYDTGKWKAANHGSIKRSLHGQINASDDWEKEGEGTGIYRLVTHSSNVEQHTNGAGGEPTPTGLNLNDDGDASPQTQQAQGVPQSAEG